MDKRRQVMHYVVKVPVSGTYTYIIDIDGDALLALERIRSRHERKGPPWRKDLIIDWDNALIDGDSTDAAAVATVDEPPPVLKPDQKVEWAKVQHLLGKVPDTQIAARLGISNTVVRKHRLATARKSVERHKVIIWAAYDHLLGKMTDTELAYKIGCDRTTVSARRKKLGIPSYKNTLNPLI
jgi:hypothetical protein